MCAAPSDLRPWFFDSTSTANAASVRACSPPSFVPRPLKPCVHRHPATSSPAALCPRGSADARCACLMRSQQVVFSGVAPVAGRRRDHQLMPLNPRFLHRSTKYIFGVHRDTPQLFWSLNTSLPATPVPLPADLHDGLQVSSRVAVPPLGRLCAAVGECWSDVVPFVQAGHDMQRS